MRLRHLAFVCLHLILTCPQLAQAAASQYTLPFRAAAEAFFAEDLSSVRVFVRARTSGLGSLPPNPPQFNLPATRSRIDARDHRSPEDFGAAAFTYGEEIHFNRNLQLTEYQFLRLLGHELAHVVQQRRGLISPSHRQLGRPSNQEKHWEKVADSTGTAFANFVQQSRLSPGNPPAWVGWNYRSFHAPRKTFLLSRPPAPVLQFSITVAGQPIHTLSQFSTQTRSILDLISGGVAWVDYAIRSNFAYQFADQGAMLASVQQGLHEEPTIWLPRTGLRIHPARLLALSAADLSALVSAEATGNAAGSTVIASNQLLADAQIRQINGFLQQLGLRDAPLLASLSFADQLVLAKLESNWTAAGVSSDMAREAATFALARAQSPVILADLMQFYVNRFRNTSGTPSLATTTPAGRQTAAAQSLARLTPYLFELLNCPQGEGPTDFPSAVMRATAWVRAGNSLGYIRLSAAAADLVQLRATDDSQLDLSQIVKNWQESASAIILHGTPSAGALRQDGKEAIIHFVSGQLTATVAIDEAGTIGLLHVDIPAANSSSAR